MKFRFLALLAATGHAFIPNNNHHGKLNQQLLFSQTLENAGTVSENSGTKMSVEPDMKAYSRGYFTLTEEIKFKKIDIENKIDLKGTYFRCGPAMFTAGSIPPSGYSAVMPKTAVETDGSNPSRMVKHPFDGDGAVVGITFTENECYLRCRFVKTTGYEKERKKGQKMYTGMESTRSTACDGNNFPKPLFKHHLQPGLNKNRKNTSNTRAIYWGKRLLSLWEGGLPYKLDTLALSTEGKSQLGGVLKETTSFSGSCAYDSTSNRMVFYANEGAEVTVYEFDDSFRLIGDKTEQRSVKMEDYALLSDIAVTSNYSVFIQPTLEVNGMQFAFSKDPAKCLTTNDSKSATLHLVPRMNSSKAPISVSIPIDEYSDADIQFCNAYEDDGYVIVDGLRSLSSKQNKSSCSWPWVNSLSKYSSLSSPKSLWRYKWSKSSGTVTKEMLSDAHCEFPVINPSISGKKHRFIYANSGASTSPVSPPQGIIKFDVEAKSQDVWFPESFEFCGEPMFAPKASSDSSSDDDEDEGYVITLVYNGKTNSSDVLVFDAKSISKGPVSRIPLGVALPHGLHGTFDSSCVLDGDEILRRSKLADKMEAKGNRWNEVKSDFSGLGLRLDDFDEYFGDFL